MFSALSKICLAYTKGNIVYLMHFSPKCSIFEIIAKMYNFSKIESFRIKLPPTDSKKNLRKKAPTYFFLTWGAYDQIFSQFLKVSFNNVVKKFAKICNFF